MLMYNEPGPAGDVLQANVSYLPSEIVVRFVVGIVISTLETGTASRNTSIHQFILKFI